MIICHQKKFIFFHNKKTSGTTLEICLSKLCGIKDYISFNSNEAEKTKANLSFPPAQNFETRKINFKKTFQNINCLSLILIKNYLFNKKKNLEKNFKIIQYLPKYYGHIDPVEFKKKTDLNIWNNYFKFTVYRNFSDQIYSMYNHHMTYKKYVTYDEYLDENLDSFFKEVEKFYQYEEVFCLDFKKIGKSLDNFEKKINSSIKLYEIYQKIKTRNTYFKHPRILSQKNQKKIDSFNLYFLNLNKKKFV